MDERFCVSDKRGDDNNNGDSGLSEVIVRDYDEVLDRISFSILVKDYFLGLKGVNLDVYVVLGQDRGQPYRINNIEAQVLTWLNNDKARIKVVEKDGQLIGFMVYHYFFDSILVARHIYICQSYRHRTLLRSLIFSVGHVSRVFSQTLSKHGPEEIQGLKKNRLLVHETEDSQVWENIVSKGNRRNHKWQIKSGEGPQYQPDRQYRSESETQTPQRSDSNKS